MANPNIPTSTPTLANGIEIGPEMSKVLLWSFRSLFTYPDLVSKIQKKIDTLPNGIDKMLMNAALRRILHHISSAQRIQEVTYNKLKWLMELRDRTNSLTQQA